jgi:phospholipase C
VLAPIVNKSSDPANDALLGPSGLCGTSAVGAYLDRCGYGPRLPFLAISPFAKANFIAHTVADQSSITRFIEDNWGLGQVGDQSFDAIAGPITNLFDFKEYDLRKVSDRTLILDPTSGQPQEERW